MHFSWNHVHANQIMVLIYTIFAIYFVAKRTDSITDIINEYATGLTVQRCGQWGKMFLMEICVVYTWRD